ncbi:nitrogen fixation protein NifA [Lujinxingia litoralis]|uniref:Nitrogen fixation protein NifA n=1 Tax=Lujinxingia litoralis TaxID=2211119 RepID=A0A328CAJ6_9DELT|nr:sigma-54 dependent transcriptional regulator [Lujinxingia litoralis]RAL23519.1 nitrogen fixation protein NifA [Lujinxingia litoralis]
MSSIVDWNALSLNVAVRELATLLRENLQVRVALVCASGEVVDLGDATGGEAALFDVFADTRGRWGSAEHRVTYAQTVRAWSNACLEVEAGTERVILERAPGFCAHLYPIATQRERAAIVCAGFVNTESAAQSLESIRKVLPDHVLEAIESGQGPRVPQLGREDRRWMDRLGQRIARVMANGLAEEQVPTYQPGARRLCGMLGASGPMTHLFGQIERVARTNATILITGENGTGKELVASAVHRHSRRRDEAFIPVNCAAIPGDLIASELFGHVKGAFSGAHRDRAGLFEAADRGTLLLDEIGDMDPMLQTKLLRVLQEGTFLRVGDNQVRKVDVRVICATNCDLEAMVERGEFRRDLYYRIRVIELALPALRERGEDILLLANHFLSATAKRHGRAVKRFSAECQDYLESYPWPGNVREMENEIERLVILSGDAEEIGSEWLSRRIVGKVEQVPVLDTKGYNLPEAVELLERQMILEGLQKAGWNKSQAAKDLGISRRNLIRKVSQFELEERAHD